MQEPLSELKVPPTQLAVSVSPFAKLCASVLLQLATAFAYGEFGASDSQVVCDDLHLRLPMSGSTTEATEHG